MISAPTIEELKSVPWESEIERNEQPIPDYYFRKYWKDKSNSSTDDIAKKVYRFLDYITFMLIYPESCSWDNRHSQTLENLDDQALNIIEELANTTRIPGLRAYFSNLIWVRRKNYQFASMAALAYWDAAKLAIEEGSYYICGHTYLLRCIELGKVIKKKELLEVISNDLVARIERDMNDDVSDRYKCDILIEFLVILVKTKLVEKKEANYIATGIINKLKEKNINLEDIYDIAISSSNEIDRGKFHIEKAEYFKRKADLCIRNQDQNYMAGWVWLKESLTCYQQGKAPKEIVDNIKKMIDEWGKEMLGKMKTFRVEVDSTPMIDAVQNQIGSSNTIEEAITRMAFCVEFIDVNRHKEQVFENLSNSLSAHLCNSYIFTNEGHARVILPPVFDEQGAINEGALLQHMFHHAVQDMNIRACYIQECIKKINEQYPVTLDNIAFLTENNPFIKEGHEMFFRKGILEGFKENFDLTALLIVPQLEESIRHCMKDKGISTTTTDERGLQVQKLLGTLLGSSEIESVFCPEIVFELRVLLCEKEGYELRNRLCHGFVKYDELWGADVYNVWWLAIKLLLMSRGMAMKRENNPIQS